MSREGWAGAKNEGGPGVFQFVASSVLPRIRTDLNQIMFEVGDSLAFTQQVKFVGYNWLANLTGV